MFKSIISSTKPTGLISHQPLNAPPRSITARHPAEPLPLYITSPDPIFNRQTSEWRNGDDCSAGPDEVRTSGWPVHRGRRRVLTQGGHVGVYGPGVRKRLCYEDVCPLRASFFAYIDFVIFAIFMTVF